MVSKAKSEGYYGGEFELYCMFYELSTQKAKVTRFVALISSSTRFSPTLL